MKKDSSPLQLDWSAVSDVGRVRRNNEDSWGVFVPAQGAFPVTQEEIAMGAGGVLLLVSDGMGGAQGGEEASRFCIERCAQEIAHRHDRHDHAAVVREAMTVTHVALLARAQSRNSWRGMGATLSALWLHANGTGVVGHIGDSRVYQRHGGKLRQLTEDHNLGAGMVRRGEMTEEAVTRFKYRSMLEQVMGGDGRVLEPQLVPVKLAAGDCFALCSDGLFGPLRDNTDQLMARALQEAGLAGAAQSLVDAANAAGGQDNVTVLLARVV
ncbi:MAG: protein phosphatase [Lacunisphaera sp.]|nr:protein phosphatase [Lacunisphaera sp.]